MALSAQTVENSKLLLLRGDATETVRITDCLLKSFSDQKVHTQQCRPAPRQKSASPPFNFPAHSNIEIAHYRTFIHYKYMT